jgi:hypothetical protein
MMHSTMELASMLVVLCCMLQRTYSSITELPQNTVIPNGQAVQVNCSTNLSATPNPIKWTVNGILAISTGCVSTNPVYAGTLSGQTCDLRNNNTNPSGYYGCSDGTTGEKAKDALVVVLTTMPACVPSPNPPILGQTYDLVCGGNFTFGQTLLNSPVSALISCDGLGSSARADYKQAGPSLQLPPARFTMPPSATTTVPTYSCSIQFNFTSINDPIIEFMTNPASYPFSTSSSYNFSYCPSSVSISPSIGPYVGSQQIICSANGSPTPTYNWTSSDGVSTVTYSGPSITLPATGGNLTFVCTAYATGGLLDQCNVSTAPQLFIIEPQPPTTAWSGNSTTTANPSQFGNSTKAGGGTTDDGQSAAELRRFTIGFSVAFGLFALLLLGIYFWCVAVNRQKPKRSPPGNPPGPPQRISPAFFQAVYAQRKGDHPAAASTSIEMQKVGPGPDPSAILSPGLYHGSSGNTSYILGAYRSGAVRFNN